MGVIGFRKLIGFRARQEEVKDIDYIVSKNREKYSNRSHFVRCAVNRLVREEVKKL